MHGFAEMIYKVRDLDDIHNFVVVIYSALPR